MKEKNLREVLEKCSKAELIKTILKVSDMTFASFPWRTTIVEIKLDEVDAEIEANLAKGEELNRKLKNIPENRRNFTDDETLQIFIALKKNHEEWKQLNRKHDKLFKELYG